MHFAVAPVGSVLLAVAVGADFVAGAVLAAAGAIAGEGAAAAGAEAVPVAAGAAAAGGAAVAAFFAAAGVVLGDFCTPPCPLHAPRPEAVDVVPSLQVLELDAAAAAGAAVAGFASGVAAAVVAAAVVLAAFFTPPCPLHAPRPLAVDVVPSLQVVGSVESAACAGNPNTNTIKGAATNPMRLVFFMIN